MKNRPAYYVLSAALLALPGGLAHAVPDAQGQVSSEPAPDISQDAAMMARLNYNIGFEQFEKAQASEKAGAASRDVMGTYAEARTRFETAATADPNLKEAWNLVGYTSRRLGDYERALAAYDKALALDPRYPEAIEYRGEAYLALDRLDDVKTAYLALFASAPAQAALLLEAMRKWVDQHRRQPAGVAKARVDEFATWVESRAGLASQTAALRDDAVAIHRWN